MASPLLQQDHLLEWTGFRRPGDLEKWLRENGVPYRRGRGGRLITTQAAVDAVLIGGNDVTLNEPFDI